MADAGCWETQMRSPKVDNVDGSLEARGERGKLDVEHGGRSLRECQNGKKESTPRQFSQERQAKDLEHTELGRVYGTLEEGRGWTDTREAAGEERSFDSLRSLRMTILVG
jgi:hypothetical protein